MKITFLSDGTCEFLDNLPFSLGPRRIRRVSQILPINMSKRMTFLFLRLIFGENGKVADWTRTWHGPWQATLLCNGRQFISQERSVCLMWERTQLEN